MKSVKLFLIDEIHVLGENSRGATIEAIVSRMKTFASHSTGYESEQQQQPSQLRFIAISATIPNIDDVIWIFSWLIYLNLQWFWL